MLVAAEASGDNLGAALANEIRRRLGDNVRFVGVGGARMARAGVVSPFDISELSVLGLVEGLMAYPRVLARVKERITHFKPGIPTDPATTMGAIVSKVQLDRVLSYIASAKEEGARLIAGGGPPNDPKLAKGFYVEPTVFADVTMTMRIAREEIFGPVLGILKWSDEAKMLEEVNMVEYGLTCSIWTNDISTAHRTAGAVEAGFVWINEVGKHFLGVPFGGVKQSGIGREECFEEMLAFTQEKNIHVRLRAKA